MLKNGTPRPRNMNFRSSFANDGTMSAGPAGPVGSSPSPLSPDVTMLARAGGLAGATAGGAAGAAIPSSATGYGGLSGIASPDEVVNAAYAPPTPGDTSAGATQYPGVNTPNAAMNTKPQQNPNAGLAAAASGLGDQDLANLITRVGLNRIASPQALAQ